MELMQPHEEVLPITIPEAIQSLFTIILDVVRKNRTMVEYYIYPQETPSEIEAYKPRLQALYGRLENLATLDLPKSAMLIDDAPFLLSASLLPVVDQLLNAVHGIQEIFINHYDRDLTKRKPYGTLYDTLLYREKQLKKFQQDHMHDPQRRPADALIPMPPTSLQPSFCRFAVAFINGRDYGKVSHVPYEDLKTEDTARLRNNGGAFLSWDCPQCAFKVKYHISSSMTSNIHATDDIRTHSSIPEIEYRPSWLVKCHLYQAKARDRRGSSDIDEGDNFRPRSRKDSVGGRQEKVIRRQTEIRNPRPISIFGYAAPPRRSKSEIKTIKTTTTKQSGRQGIKPLYGCPFCWIIGKDYGHMEYSHARDLSEHIAARHNPSYAPAALVLEKLMVGLNGRCAANVRRWDINIRSTS